MYGSLVDPCCRFRPASCQPPRWHAQCVTAVERRIVGIEGSVKSKLLFANKMSVTQEYKNQTVHDVVSVKSKNSVSCEAIDQ
jgi:hypothetical protein